jgi:hypothetical protein
MNSIDGVVTAERPRDDFVMGAAAIVEFLRSEGLKDITEADIYYIYRRQKLPIGKFGKLYIASKAKLSRELRRAAKALGP